MQANVGFIVMMTYSVSTPQRLRAARHATYTASGRLPDARRAAGTCPLLFSCSGRNEKHLKKTKKSNGVSSYAFVFLVIRPAD
ncbi:hypothetical protein SUGI_0319630 [Cryptomeria japonica]|nr:hypothetical protein SUGI_0319630 [Cryptomeria japonica]